MKIKRSFTSIVALFAILISYSPAQAAESYGELNREKVVRIRSLEGNVVIQTSPDDEWVQAHEYMILTEGYRVVTGPGGIVEIELDPRHFIRLRENSEMAVYDLNSHASVFRYISGSVYVSALESRTRGIIFDMGPMRRVVWHGQGAFRIDEDLYEGLSVTVREGRATVEHESGKFDVREGEMARLNGGAGITTAYAKDSWDEYVEKRDNELIVLTEAPYIYKEIPGRYKTYGYSQWVAYPYYGYYWGPHVSIVFYGGHRHFRGYYRYGYYPYKPYRYKPYRYSGYYNKGYPYKGYPPRYYKKKGYPYYYPYYPYKPYKNYLYKYKDRHRERKYQPYRKGYGFKGTHKHKGGRHHRNNGKYKGRGNHRGKDGHSFGNTRGGYKGGNFRRGKGSRSIGGGSFRSGPSNGGRSSMRGGFRSGGGRGRR